MNLIFLDRFWFVHIPFNNMVTFLISCTIPSGSPFQPCRTQSCIFCVSLLHSFLWLMVSYLSSNNVHLLFCCISSTFALIKLVFSHHFVLFLEEILFLSCGFLFSTMSRLQSHLFIAWNIHTVIFLPILVFSFCFFLAFPLLPLLLLAATIYFFHSFLCIPRVLELLHLHNPEYFPFLFLIRRESMSSF